MTTTARDAPDTLHEAFCRTIPAEALQLPADTTLRIGEAAHLLDVSEHTLRYYEREGLVRVPRDATGQRCYGTPELLRVEFLCRMRNSGMTMSRLTRYIELAEQGDSTIAERLQLMEEHRESIVSQLQELQLALAATDYKINTYGGMLDGTLTLPDSLQDSLPAKEDSDD